MMLSVVNITNVSCAGKILLLVFFAALAVQITYLHTNKGNKIALTRNALAGTDLSQEVRMVDHKVSQPEGKRDVPSLRTNPDFFFRPPGDPLVYGKPRSQRGFLTIGIPSVRRPNTNKIYLYDTVTSLIDKIGPEQHRVTIVIMTSDSNRTYNRELADKIYSKHKQLCDSSVIHVIETSDDIYPDLTNVRQTFNDTIERLQWRAKQNIDFAFLMLYSRTISDYYIQLEDDVVAATDFLNDIEKNIKENQQNWFLLEFSRLGFIGKLIRSKDLEYSAMFLLDNYDVAPGDLLLGAMRAKRGQAKPIHSEKSLFQHVGRFSSLKNKIMPSLDNTFKDATEVGLSLDFPKGDNPSATVETSMTAYGNYTAEQGYNNDNTTFFWAKSPKKRDHYTLIFESPHNFSRIIVLTGALGTKKDSFLFGELLYSQSQTRDNETKCVNKFHNLESLVDGDLDTMATGTDIPNNIKCLRIAAKRKLRKWVIIRDILVLLKT